jgi:hypothetical protein
LSADKVELSERVAESRKVAGVRELLRLLVKTQKAQRLYDSKNAVAERLELDLYERLAAFVSEEGEVQLSVLESQLQCDGAVVFESADRTDSLAFLLYRDGIRLLSFGPGLELQELRSFLRCLNRVAVFTNDQDDLVTLLWEQDFHSIRYYAIEELARNETFPRLSDQLASGASGAPGSPAQRVTLDLKQPVSTVPIEACRLESAEIEALQKELSVEERAPFWQLVSELALEIVLLEDDDAAQDEILSEIVEIADGLIADGDVLELIGLHEHVEGLTVMIFPHERTAVRLTSELTRALTEPKRFAQLMERVETAHTVKPETLTVFLARLASSTRGAAPLLLPWMGRFSSPPYRRAVTAALLYLEDGGLAVLSEDLPLGPPPLETSERLRHRQLVREVVYALSRHAPAESLPLLTGLLSSPDPETRRESFLAVTRYPEEGVLSLCRDRLLDLDPEVRVVALDVLVKRGGADQGLEILERSLASERFEKLPLLEKRRLFAAVAKLSGENALDSLVKLLNAREDHWFQRQRDREFAEAIAHGIRMVGGPRAQRILEEASERGTKIARAACLKELAAARGSGR